MVMSEISLIDLLCEDIRKVRFCYGKIYLQVPKY